MRGEPQPSMTLASGGLYHGAGGAPDAAPDRSPQREGALPPRRPSLGRSRRVRHRLVWQVRRLDAPDAEPRRDRHLRPDDEGDEVGERHPDELRAAPDLSAIDGPRE